MAEERRTNPLLAAGELLPYLARVLRQSPYPSYYERMAPLNRVGAPLVGRNLPALRELAPDAVARLQREGAALVDLRLPIEYDRGHIPGSYNVGDAEAFSAWIGWVLPPERSLILVGGERHRYLECQRQLFRIGYDRILGAMAGTVDEWLGAGGPELTQFETGTIDDLARWLVSEEPVTILDVRNEDEWVHGHVPGAVHLTVPEVQAHGAALPLTSPVVVHCAAGYRAGLAASLLEQMGVRRIIRIEGGFPDWEARGLPSVVPG